MLTKNELSKKLSSIKIREKYVIIHSDISGLVFRNFSLKDLWSLIFNSLGKEKTYILPTFTFDFYKKKIWDYNYSKSETGLLSEFFRLKIAKKRTIHPLHSVAIYSKNPIKLQVAVKVFLDVFPDEEIKFITCDAQSGVSDQPYGTEETKTGAYNRAQDSFYKNSDVDYSVGLEGGIEIIDEEYWVTAWMCVLNREGKAGYGRTSSYQLPPKIVDLLKEGKELSDAGDIVLNDEKIGQ